MDTQEPDRSGPASISEQAADWLLRLQNAPDDLDIRQQFRAWKSADPLHVDAWERTCRVWGILGDVLSGERTSVGSIHGMPQPDVGFAGRIVSMPSPKSDTDDLSADGADGEAPVAKRRMGRWAKRVGTGAVALAATCAAILLVPGWLIDLRSDYSSPYGVTREIALDDGSHIYLSAASAVSVYMEDDRRTVELLKGEALFDVSHDEKRPFHVLSNGLDVEVLGTRFDVRRGTDANEVGLVRGSVRAKRGGATRVMKPGELLQERGTGDVMSVSQIDPDQIASWRERKLYADNTSIRSLVEQIGRFHSAWITIADSGLADMKVTGVYDLADPDAALKAIAATYGAKMYEVSPFLRVLTR